MTIDVSIVIVSFNVKNLLDNCLRSIIKETACSYEIVVVDNNSKDRSAEMVRRKYRDVILIENKSNVGFSSANNRAFKLVNGKYVLMLNPDTVILNGAIDKLVEFMDKHQEIGACGAKNVNPDMSLKRNCHQFPTISIRLIDYLQLKRFYPESRFFGREQMTYWDYSEIREVDWISGCSLIIKQKALEQVGYLDEQYFMYSEDTDLCYRLKKYGWKIIFYPDALIIHYGGESALNQNNEKVFEKTIPSYLFKTQYMFFKKNYGYISSLILKALDFLYYSTVYFKNIFRKDKKIGKAKREEVKAIIYTIFNT